MEIKNIIQIQITAELSNQRIDKVLAQDPYIETRSRALKLIERGLVSKNGRPVKASQKTLLGDLFLVEIPPAQPSELQELDLPLDILFEDDEILVLNKPSGLVMHPSAGHHQDTLVNALLKHTKDLAMGFGENRPGIVHRLDKDTSGVLVVAKTDRAQKALAIQFKERSIRRIYRAIAIGKFKNSSGAIESYLGRHPKNRKKFASDQNHPQSPPKGKWSKTHYKVLHEHPLGFSLVELRLETGRTHQIRVHLSELGHPLVGDTLYGAKLKQFSRHSEISTAISNFNRVALHAFILEFNHPQSNKRMAFQVPWPNNMLRLIEALEWN